MNKIEFINFLKEKEEKLNHTTHWKCVASNHDDQWKLYTPGVDCYEDQMDLSNNGIVKIRYDMILYDNNSIKTFETTYDDFAEHYDLTVKKKINFKYSLLVQ